MVLVLRVSSRIVLCDSRLTTWPSSWSRSRTSNASYVALTLVDQPLTKLPLRIIVLKYKHLPRKSQVKIISKMRGAYLAMLPRKVKKEAWVYLASRKYLQFEAIKLLQFVMRIVVRSQIVLVMSASSLARGDTIMHRSDQASIVILHKVIYLALVRSIKTRSVQTASIINIINRKAAALSKAKLIQGASQLNSSNRLVN